ncbi:hypothetical protein PVW53_21565 [Seohaeicola sp. SP36]|uniref:hypothetical protein n=1 Tax=Seohaeicola sp. SP36 TaxID=3028380 RepID=UPI00237AF458|nr:hypothetical protein [Seohaeicola sp. SP36]MDD9738088.1 hypothetical protein [Seohaeicola sp. SP36]
MTNLFCTTAALLPTLAVTTALATPATAGQYNRYSVPDFVEQRGMIRPGEESYPYEFLGYGGANAEIYLDSDQCRADIDVTIYDAHSQIVAFGASDYCQEDISWFVDYDQVYYIVVESIEGFNTDFYLSARNTWSH